MPSQEPTHPSEPPPPYALNASQPPHGQSSSQDTSHLQVPSERMRNGIPPSARRSMEDEARSLPAGWIRQFDAETRHQFFIDTTATPPRSIWHHPYDDEEYLSTLSSAERESLVGQHEFPSREDINAMTSGESDIEDHPKGNGVGVGGVASTEKDLDKPKGIHKLTRKMKDKLTHSTHTEREAFRQKRAQEEAAAYERHRMIRAAMMRAIETGQPQYLGQNREGKGVYIDPPSRRGNGLQMGNVGGYPAAMGYGGPGYGWGGPPGVGCVRPGMGYGRRPGYGYGGGMGLPLMGGLVGGALLGGALF
ncbi:hypothetical protein HYALB_00007768 [Hymenoscyphus albidus]|uniref:WW domain-containing protein n=1 Tax=Hymenoscyphus albidus TaxID=595503 RepID=A0A9N9LTU9_9HELO|nr:hypothetical protein HYALB_00007768 [Hymenoscyphus albidus]